MHVAEGSAQPETTSCEHKTPELWYNSTLQAVGYSPLLRPTEAAPVCVSPQALQSIPTTSHHNVVAVCAHA